MNENFPNNYDEEEAATAVTRLQEIYLLNTTDLARGQVAGLKGATDLTASDCFLLGINAQDKKNYGLAVSWFQQSMDRFNEDEFQLLSKTLLLEVHAFSAYQIGDIERALQLAQDISKIDPHFPNIENILKLFEEELIKKTEDNNDSKANYENLKSEIAINEPPEEVDPTVLDVGKYRKLCRGEKTRTPDQGRKLKCRYTSNGSTYLLLQPAKEEVLNLKPRIVVYHDVIRDKDIELLKELAEKRLERAFVTDSGTGVKEYSKDRLSKNANIEDSFHPRVSHISKMIGEVTGLDMKAAENLQINKYGIGGYYAAHCDYRRISEKADPEWLLLGNRIATWLFYLSDVLAGGSTVFPDVGVEVKPIKGSAAFWYNLFPSGEGDLRTKHAACPVIAGEKWVANKWIHEAGQEFRRPCGMNPLHSSLIKYTQ